VLLPEPAPGRLPLDPRLSPDAHGLGPARARRPSADGVFPPHPVPAARHLPEAAVAFSGAPVAPRLRPDRLPDGARPPQLRAVRSAAAPRRAHLGPRRGLEDA